MSYEGSSWAGFGPGELACRRRGPQRAPWLRFLPCSSSLSTDFFVVLLACKTDKSLLVGAGCRKWSFQTSPRRCGQSPARSCLPWPPGLSRCPERTDYCPVRSLACFLTRSGSTFKRKVSCRPLHPFGLFCLRLRERGLAAGQAGPAKGWKDSGARGCAFGQHSASPLHQR